MCIYSRPKCNEIAGISHQELQWNSNLANKNLDVRNFENEDSRQPEAGMRGVAFRNALLSKTDDIFPFRLTAKGAGCTTIPCLIIIQHFHSEKRVLE